MVTGNTELAFEVNSIMVGKYMKIVGLCLCLSLLISNFCGCGRQDEPIQLNSGVSDETIDAISRGNSKDSETKEESKSETKEKPEGINVAETRGSKQPIPQEIRQKMKGISMPEGATVTFDDLSYLTISHYDYNGRIVKGHMVVSVEIADEVLDIFEELLEIKFPIEKMELVDYYTQYIDETFNNLDRASMSQNNTSAFYYRVVNGTNTISNHAYGRAIDINPKINPYYVPATGYVSPANAYQYASRNQDLPGIIRHGDPIYEIFISRGWEWGGDWSGEKDYQHFQKPRR